ncbi:hypothetical protein QBC37DRAFT_399028 [Rhypophila decipiens]|uniref:SET domain-containing protein n=1 Tax=Rhypophila decipiens TaxID=261697 RepID=A0AAN6YAL8_9PEZI|nr:hypothetical protein QBC37DRAFT_399028 [Rhypophila decipiens]
MSRCRPCLAETNPSLDRSDLQLVRQAGALTAEKMPLLSAKSVIIRPLSILAILNPRVQGAHHRLGSNTCLNRFPSSLCDFQSPVPIDDETPLHILLKSPWSYPPYCLASTNAPDEQWQHLSEKLCVYTSTSFNEYSGISIIARPETAATLVAAISNRTASQSARHHIAGHAHLPGAPDSLPYVVTAIPGKGIGVIATKPIPQFSTIMVSFPALVIDDELFPDDDEHEVPVEGPRLFTRALGQLADKKRALDLAKSRHDGKIHVVEDVVRTNAFGIYAVDGRDFKGLYPEIAWQTKADMDRSAYGRFTKADLAMTAVATRDIEPGEEITISCQLNIIFVCRYISYSRMSDQDRRVSDISLGMPSVYRQQALANWSFKCTCALCTSAPEALSASDSRREKLVELLHEMNQLVPVSSKPLSVEQIQANYEKLVVYTREFVEILQIERLFPKVGEYYQRFMKLYYGFGDIESAYKYARTALKFAEIFSDPDGGFCWGLRRDSELLERLIAEQEE